MDFEFARAQQEYVHRTICFTRPPDAAALPASFVTHARMIEFPTNVYPSRLASALFPLPRQVRCYYVFLRYIPSQPWT